jgi:hypothetical protein
VKKKDLLWLLLYPVYQTIGTVRHEGSHSLAAMAEGAKVTKFVFWPNFDLGRFHWGYVGWQGSTTWFFDAAPYFCDLLIFFVAFLVILEAKPEPRWLWLNILIIGVLSPLVNSGNAYIAGLRGSGDVGYLLHHLNPVVVHLYFALTLLLYAWGLYHCYFRKKTWHPK